MTTAERIRKLGFKRWYERALIEGHAYLVTAFLGMIATFAGIELIGEHNGFWRAALGFGAAAFGTVIAIYGIYRYHRILVMAQTLGDRAICKQCNAYAAFNIIASATGMTRSEEETELSGTVWLRVRCRQCGHEWTI